MEETVQPQRPEPEPISIRKLDKLETTSYSNPSGS
jgi:hypothetical protein